MENNFSKIFKEIAKYGIDIQISSFLKEPSEIIFAVKSSTYKDCPERRLMENILIAASNRDKTIDIDACMNTVCDFFILLKKDRLERGSF